MPIDKFKKFSRSHAPTLLALALSAPVAIIVHSMGGHDIVKTVLACGLWFVLGWFSGKAHFKTDSSEA